PLLSALTESARHPTAAGASHSTCDARESRKSVAFCGDAEPVTERIRVAHRILSNFPRLAKFVGCPEWHCRLARNDLRRKALAWARRAVGVALFPRFGGKANPGRVSWHPRELRLAQDLPWSTISCASRPSLSHWVDLPHATKEGLDVFLS